MPMKPSETEQEYFLKLEIEKLKKARAERDAQVQEEEKKKARELHWMKCPKCGMDLHEIEFRKVKVDFCASCHGYWFDSGEVMQLLEMEKEHGLFGKLLKTFTH